jgi:hypothetical protein
MGMVPMAGFREHESASREERVFDLSRITLALGRISAIEG